MEKIKKRQAGLNSVLLAAYIGGIKMTVVQKNEIILKVVTLLNEMLDIDAVNDSSTENITHSNDEQPVELLTVKECVGAISGLSEHTLRQLITQDKIPCIRTGEGKRGKILINKSALLDYLKNSI